MPAVTPKAQSPEMLCESPEFVRVSLAAAMTLGFVDGWFYRNAQLGCVNLLMTYESGCRANCAFCGLARDLRDESGARKFIRVPWRVYSLDQVLEALQNRPPYVERVCVSMITHPRSTADSLTICDRVRKSSGLPVSMLIAPSVMTRDDLLRMRDAGADKIGTAIDAATPVLFDAFRGKGVRGPHNWERYWRTYANSLEVFGRGMSGVHLIVGLGETEREMVGAMDRARSLGGGTHLFSFFPERGSALARHESPPIGVYHRIQLARWLIDTDRSRAAKMAFDDLDRITDFGVSASELEAAISCGVPFQTSGCAGPSGKVACNRPYGNEKPGLGIRNFPFPPSEDDITEIRNRLEDYAPPCGRDARPT